MVTSGRYAVSLETRHALSLGLRRHFLRNRELSTGMNLFLRYQHCFSEFTLHPLTFAASKQKSEDRSQKPDRRLAFQT